MKHLSIILFLFLSACSVSSLNDTQINDKVKQDIKTALSQNDTRLYFLGGRVPNFPGIEAAEVEYLVSQCGKRIMENTSDFIQKDEDLAAREFAFKYATQYNQNMKINCQK